MIAHATSLKNQVSALLYASRRRHAILAHEARRQWRDTLCAVCPSATTKAPYALNTRNYKLCASRAGQPLTFEIEARCDQTRARAGVVRTPHGAIRTPVFMPVGTHATVKAVGPDDLEAIGAQIVLSNTYHLLLRPGPELVARFGGLHGFMRWASDPHG